jgi:hypothetical protein
MRWACHSESIIPKQLKGQTMLLYFNINYLLCSGNRTREKILAK